MSICSRALVTGGAGFVGSHLVDHLMAADVDLVVLDDFYAGRFENIAQHVGKRNFHLAKGDIRDSSLAKDLMRDIEVVFHQAALVSPSESIENPILTNDVNVNGTLNLLSASANSKVERFVFASTCAVYGDTEILPIKEDSSLRPISPYGVSKLAAENYVRIFNEVFGLKTVCLRYFNVFGRRQACSKYSGVITQFMDRIAKDLPLIVFGDGKQSRDFVHVQDVVQANMLAVKCKEAEGDTFNVATGVATTINQLTDVLMSLTGKRPEVILTDARRGDIESSLGDVSKAERRLGFKASLSLEEGLKDLIVRSRV